MKVITLIGVKRPLGLMCGTASAPTFQSENHLINTTRRLLALPVQKHISLHLQNFDIVMANYLAVEAKSRIEWFYQPIYLRWGLF